MATNQGTTQAQASSGDAQLDPLTVATTPWQRAAHEYLRDRSRAGHHLNPAIDEVLMEVGDGDRTVGAARLNAMTEEEIGPHVFKAMDLCLKSAQRQQLETSQQLERIHGIPSNPRTATAGSLERFQRNADEARALLPTNEVRGSDGGSSTSRDILSSIPDLIIAMQTRPPPDAQAITEETLENQQQRLQLAQNAVRAGEALLKAGREMAVGLQTLGNSMEQNAQHQQAQLQILEQRMDQRMEQRFQQGFDALASRLEVQLATRQAPDQSEVRDDEDMEDQEQQPHGPASPPQDATGAEAAELASGEQPMPTDKLPPGLELGQVAGIWHVFKGSIPMLHSSWRRAVLDGIDPFTTSASKVSLPKPPPFSGDTGELEPEMAILTFENWLKASQIPREQWGMSAQYFLRGQAHRAYSTLALTKHHRGETPSWEDVVKLIRDFKRQDASLVARMKLAQVQQTTSVAAYNRHFAELMMQVGPQPPAPLDLLHYYLKGLKKAQLLNPQGQTWSSLEEAQQHHLQRELAQLTLQGPANQKPHFSKHSSKPRLNATTVQKQNNLSVNRQTLKVNGGFGGGRGRGDAPGGRGGGRGGRGNSWSEVPGRTPARPQASLEERNALFGTGNALWENLNERCPAHLHSKDQHLKRDCGIWKGLTNPGNRDK